MIVQIIIALISFLLIKYSIYWILENDKLPHFLNYKPYSCYLCCGFWANLFYFSTMFIINNNWYILSIYGLILTILDTIALYIDEKNTTSINDLEDE